MHSDGFYIWISLSHSLFEWWTSMQHAKASVFEVFSNLFMARSSFLQQDILHWVTSYKKPNLAKHSLRIQELAWAMLLEEGVVKYVTGTRNSIWIKYLCDRDLSNIICIIKTHALKSCFAIMSLVPWYKSKRININIATYCFIHAESYSRIDNYESICAGNRLNM